MEEKVLHKNENGMIMMLLFIMLYVFSVLAIIFGAIMMDSNGVKFVPGIVLFIIGLVYAIVGWIFFLGLKVLKPQEALVLTLFGKYVGTLKEAGFFYVNPFCTGVNPASSTKLSQSGDVNSGSNKLFKISASDGISAGVNSECGKKISLKIMTLNNSRQKINDTVLEHQEISLAV